MPTRRVGWLDAQQSSRLSGTWYLALYAGVLPLSDGSGGMEIGPATRPAIPFNAPVQDGNGRHYQDNTIMTVTLTNTSAAHIVGFGCCSAATGATVQYSGWWHYGQVSPGQTITIPAGAIRMYAEPATI